MLRIVRTTKTREIYNGDKRIFLTTIGEDFGECSVEVAEKQMEKALLDWEEECTES